MFHTQRICRKLQKLAAVCLAFAVSLSAVPAMAETTGTGSGQEEGQETYQVHVLLSEGGTVTLFPGTEGQQTVFVAPGEEDALTAYLYDAEGCLISETELDEDSPYAVTAEVPVDGQKEEFSISINSDDGYGISHFTVSTEEGEESDAEGFTVGLAEFEDNAAASSVLKCRVKAAMTSFKNNALLAVFLSY